MSTTTKTFFGKIFSWIGDIFHKAETELVPVILPFIGALLNGVKAVVTNSLTADAITFFAGPALSSELLSTITTALTKVSDEFNLVVDLSGAKTQADVDAVLQKVFASVKWPTDVAKQVFLSSFGARVLQEIKSNEMTFAQAVIDVEYFYQNYIVNPPTLPPPTDSAS